MNICSDGHKEICYEGRNCPCCDIMGEKKELEEKIDSLKDTISELKNEKDDLQNQLDSINNP
jgi:predicted nuclease with TOPRIM domain